MKISNKSWRIDDDGFLRVTACILQTDVLEYSEQECPFHLDGRRHKPGSNDVVYQYVNVDDISPEVLHSLEGKPVIIGEHSWQTIGKNTPIGSIAGSPTVENGQILVDVLVANPDVIAKIKHGDLVEISAGYDASIIEEPGEWNGKTYDVIQVPTNFNHILLLPEGCGRCGSDVKIINVKYNKDNEVSMKIIKLYNKDYRFQNEDDSVVAEEMVEETKALNAEELQNACDELQEVKNQVEELTKKREELEALVEEYKKRIEELLSPEHTAELVQEAVEQNADEEAVLEDAELDNEEDVKEQCKNSKTYADRRRVIVENCMRGSDVTGWTQDAIDGAFEVLVNNAKNKAKKIMNSAVASKVDNVKNNLDRMLRPLSNKR